MVEELAGQAEKGFNDAWKRMKSLADDYLIPNKTWPKWRKVAVLAICILFALWVLGSLRSDSDE